MSPALAVSPGVSSSWRYGTSPAPEVMVAPWNSKLVWLPKPTGENAWWLHRLDSPDSNGSRRFFACIRGEVATSSGNVVGIIWIIGSYGLGSECFLR